MEKRSKTNKEIYLQKNPTREVMNMENFGLFNVVWYDGYRAYATKFILLQKNYGDISKETHNSLVEYLNDTCELLKVDYLFPLSFDTIIAFETSDDVELKNSFDRFKCMYFRI